MALKVSEVAYTEVSEGGLGKQCTWMVLEESAAHYMMRLFSDCKTLFKRDVLKASSEDQINTPLLDQWTFVSTHTFLWSTIHHYLQACI